jgi:hypothetical protein
LPHFATIPLVFLGVVAVLTPILALGVTASKLDPQERTGVTVLYAGVVFLVGIIAADIAGALPDRLAVDLALLAGGITVGVYAARVFSPRWSSWRRHGR